MRGSATRRAFLATVATTSFAGCFGIESDTSGEGDVEEPNVEVKEIELDIDVDWVYVGENPPTDEPENAPPISERVLPISMPTKELTNHVVDAGTPKDAIPSISDPTFVPASETDFLSDGTPVFGVVGTEDVKAYPRDVLVYHEIVNDVIDGIPVSVTYCPLTGTAVGFRRGDTEFGVSGMLLNNNLVMYDRELERWWPQIPAVSIPGPWHDTVGGATLEEFPVVRTTWGRWRVERPETLVMTRETGYARDYLRDPYGEGGYYQSSNTLFENLHASDRHHAKEWVYGVRTSDGAAAFLKDTLESVGMIQGTIGDTPLLAVYDPRLDTSYVYRNDQQESFTESRGTVADEQENEYAPSDLPLERLISFDAFWFAWVATYPNTLVYE